MSSLDAIQPLTNVTTELRPELRPELDRAVLQSYQLTQFYNLQEQRMITPIAYRDEGERTDAVDPLLYEGAARPGETVGRPDDAGPRPRWESAREPSEGWSPGALRTDIAVAEGEPAMPHAVAAEAAPGSGEMSTTMPSEPSPLPYGADPGRIRQLVDEIIEGHAFVPLTFQYRQAGDLLPVKPTVASGAAFGPVRAASAYKAF